VGTGEAYRQPALVNRIGRQNVSTCGGGPAPGWDGGMGSEQSRRAVHATDRFARLTPMIAAGQKVRRGKPGILVGGGSAR
jgi:hypothetical protein